MLEEISRNLLRESPSDALIKVPINENDEEIPTTSIRVLLVDEDSNSSILLKNLMTQFSYRVTSYENGEEAMTFLKENKQELDLVIWEFNMPKINGLQALTTIGKKMDLPIAIMSSDHKKETVTKSMKYGACDFLVKPLSREVVAVLWRHALMSRNCGLSKRKRQEAASSSEVDEHIDRYESNEEEGSRTAEYSGDHNTSDSKGDKSKKPRMHWTLELHQKFEKAVQELGGPESAYPKQILKHMQEEMNVQGLDRNKVASHLQKYRLSTNKKICVRQETEEDLALEAYKPVGNIISQQYFTNDLAGTNDSIQYPPSMMHNNPFTTTRSQANYPCIDQFHQLQQQQYPPLQLPSDQLTYDPNLLFDPQFNLPYYYNFSQFK